LAVGKFQMPGPEWWAPLLLCSTPHPHKEEKSPIFRVAKAGIEILKLL
jgi:hypothetical protein